MYKKPLEYDSETIEDVMNKKIKLTIGNIITLEIEKYIIGSITHCELAANPPNLPAVLTFTADDGSISRISIGEIVAFEDALK